MVIGLILVMALVGFEIFNFDTTSFALQNLMADASFAGIPWANILALAFCAIDFAGLAHLFTPERGQEEPREIWYLTGAWLLGATMNALMTWWAVTLVIIEHPMAGNEVLSHQQLLNIVPIFVAVLVWLTRILFIGAISVAGEHLFWGDNVAAAARKDSRGQRRPQAQQQAEATLIRQPAPASPRPLTVEQQPDWERTQQSKYSEEMPAFIRQRGPNNSHIPQQRPPAANRMPANVLQARSRRR